jgi:phosphate-selective porin OprO/OprP
MPTNRNADIWALLQCARHRPLLVMPLALRKPLHIGLVCSVATCALAVSIGGARAQTTQVNGQIQSLQQQIQLLQQQNQQIQQQNQQVQQQLRSLQNQVNARAQAPAAPAVAAAPGPHVTQSATNRFGFESADGQYSIALTGRLHLDFGGYPSVHADSHFTTPQDLNDGVNARRARLGIVGKFAGDWNYTFIYDFGGSNDNGPASLGYGEAPNAGATGGLENAYITYNGLNKGPVPLVFDAGYQDVPFTLDEATSSNDIMFMERSSSQVVAASLNESDFRSAVDVHSNSDRYWTGLYLTGPVSGGNHSIGTSGEQYGVFGRATYQALVGPNYSFHIGVDADALLHPATATTGLTSLVLGDRPELRVDPTDFLTTTIGPNVAGSTAGEVKGAQVYGIESAGGYDNLFAQGEAYNYRIDRLNMASNTFWGGYLEGSWTVTGEHRNYIPATGAYSGIIPTHPFSLSGGTWGAFELAARLSYIDLDDNFSPSAGNGVSTTSNSVEGGRQTVYGLGLNWYVNSNMRFMFDYLHAVIKKTSGVTTTGTACTAITCGQQIGATIDEVGARMQVAF